MRSISKAVALAAMAIAMAGCTVHPRGESAERAVALEAGKAYVHPVEERTLPVLTAEAMPEELVTYALLNNADLEQKYWMWRSALEQVPQEGTQKTNLVITLNSMISNGVSAAAQNSLAIGNDAMNNIVLPSKLEGSARVALEEAKAAGKRFDEARYELRNKVLTAYADFAMTGELVRLEQANLDLITLTQRVTESRIGTGGAGQQELLKIGNELELSRNELAAQRAKLPQQMAGINALLNRNADAVVAVPEKLAEVRALQGDDAAILKAAAERNPELQALAMEIAGKKDAIARAKMEYEPEFGVTVSTDLAGIAQSLVSSVALPMLRYQAIDAGIRQAEADLRAAEAARRQSGHDLATRVVGDLAMLHDLDRQIALFDGTILPAAGRIVAAAQNNYATGQSSLVDLLGEERSVVALRRMRADFVTSRAKALADVEAAVAGEI